MTMGEKVYINICYISSLQISKTAGIQPSKVIVNPLKKRDTILHPPRKSYHLPVFPRLFLRFCVLTFPHGDMGIKDISLAPNGELLCEKNRLKKTTRNLTSWNSRNAQKLQIRLKAEKKIEAQKNIPCSTRNIQKHNSKKPVKKYAFCPKRKWSYSNKPWKKICLLPQKESRLWTLNFQPSISKGKLAVGFRECIVLYIFSSSLRIIGRSQVTALFWRSNKSPRSPPFSFIPPGECDFCHGIQYNPLIAFPWIVYFTYIYHLKKKTNKWKYITIYHTWILWVRYV